MGRGSTILLVLSIILFLRIGMACKSYVECSSASRSSQVTSWPLVSYIRTHGINVALNNLPSPHSELLLGLTLGIDRLVFVPAFKRDLIRTGTIHVVVVSGYNLSLVFDLVFRLLGSRYKKSNLFLGIVVTLFYSVVTGFSPPVVRAWVMGVIVLLSRFYGRATNTINILVISGLLMCLYSPFLLFNLSFQLSFLATLSLLLFSKPVSLFITRAIPKLKEGKGMLFQDFVATLAAQVLVWPFLSYKFGIVSLLSPVINGLFLWTVPLATILGSILLLVGSISDLLAQILSLIVFAPLDVFIKAVTLFSKVAWVTIPFKINFSLLMFYYGVVGILHVLWLRKAKNEV